MLYFISLLNTLAVGYFAYNFMYKVKKNEKQKMCVVDSVSTLNETFFNKLNLNEKVNLYYLEITNFDDKPKIVVLYDSRNKMPLLIKTINGSIPGAFDVDSMYEVFVSEVC